jgi:hypothetical protein
VKPEPKRRKARVPATSHDLIKKLAEIVAKEGHSKVAERLEMDRAHIYKLLSGERSPGPSTHARLYAKYPAEFPYLKHLLDEDRVRR